MRIVRIIVVSMGNAMILGIKIVINFGVDGHLDRITWGVMYVSSFLSCITD